MQRRPDTRKRGGPAKRTIECVYVCGCDLRTLSDRSSCEHIPRDGSYSRSVKEVIQPQVPLRLPCYDFAPVTALAFGRLVLAVPTRTSGAHSFHGVTGGVYKARERIHRDVADSRLLAIPTSRSRVADSDPDYDWLSGIGMVSRLSNPLYRSL